MADIADRYITPSGRTATYDREAFVGDVVTVSSFLAWAEGEVFGAVRAEDAFQAFARIADIDVVKLRRAAKGEF